MACKTAVGLSVFSLSDVQQSTAGCTVSPSFQGYIYFHRTKISKRFKKKCVCSTKYLSHLFLYHDFLQKSTTFIKICERCTSSNAHPSAAALMSCDLQSMHSVFVSSGAFSPESTRQLLLRVLEWCN